MKSLEQKQKHSKTQSKNGMKQIRRSTIIMFGRSSPSKGVIVIVRFAFHYTTGQPFELFEASWCHMRHVIPYIHCTYFVTPAFGLIQIIGRNASWTQNFAPFNPKCWYDERKVNKDNLPYVFRVLFCVLVAFSIACSRLSDSGEDAKVNAWSWHARLIHKGAKFCVLWSTDHLNQTKCGCYEIQ